MWTTTKKCKAQVFRGNRDGEIIACCDGDSDMPCPLADGERCEEYEDPNNDLVED